MLENCTAYSKTFKKVSINKPVYTEQTVAVIQNSIMKGLITRNNPLRQHVASLIAGFYGPTL